MGIKYSQNELKTSCCEIFLSQGSTHGVDSCTGVNSWGWLMHRGRLMGSAHMAQNRNWQFYNFGLHSNRGRLIGSTHANGSTHRVNSQSASQNFSMPFSSLNHESTHGIDSKIKFGFLVKYTFKNIEIFSSRLHVFCSCSWGFWIRTW